MDAVSKSDEILISFFMDNRIFAMDTHFMCANEGPTAEEQAVLVKETGYDDYYVTWAVNKPQRFTEILDASKAVGLGLNAAFECFDISKPPSDDNLLEIERVLKQIESPTRFEIALVYESMYIRPGDQTLDGQAQKWLTPISELLEKYNIPGSLYPHMGYYLETFTDAMRLIDAVGSSNLGVIFCGYHWYSVGKESDFNKLISEAGERLNAVNLCGSRFIEVNPNKKMRNPTIEPLDVGALDNAGIIESLRKHSFKGPIGIQGYDVTASAKEALERSSKQLKSLLSE